jgi:aerobic carbon-monoxide dehydrogenase medium subunit
MKPAPFDYFRPASVAETVALLARYGGDAKLLAGGQSLVPLLNFRMLRPSVLIDINRLAEFEFLRDHEGGLRIGALTRHHTLEASALVGARFPVIGEAMGHVAHLAIRNRGTIGGSLAQADPAAELPMLAVLLDAEIHTCAPAGPRIHRARDFFLGPLTTALAEDEMVSEIILPALPPRTGWAFEEVAQRAGDFAVAAVAATVTVSEGIVCEARLAMMGVEETPLRLRAVEARLAGETFATDLIRSAAREACAAVRPATDLRASAEYRRHLVGVLAERVLATTWSRALEAAA